MKDGYIEDFISGQEVKATPGRVKGSPFDIKQLVMRLFVSHTALCLFSGGNVGFGYVIFNELVLKCCAGYTQNF